MTLLPCVEIEPAEPATASVIWLHGLGANGHDFEPIVPELQLPASLAVRFVFPHAPPMPVTINGGMMMPAWYDILGMGPGSAVDVAGIRASADRIDALIEREVARGIAHERIVLAGFSQGGAVAYESTLRHPHRLAGLMALSTYFASADSIALSDANRDLPIHVFHGTRDPMVIEERGRQAVATLRALGYRPDYDNYPMEHAVCLEEIRDIAAFLQRILG